jgi:hypothetical protein
MYSRFMKFSVAPESMRAMLLALLAVEWTYIRTVIDFQADIYTDPSVLLCLTRAKLIRRRKNPVILQTG